MNEQDIGHLIDKLNPGDTVTSYFILRKVELKTKRDGDPYLVIGLGDASGHISATLWDKVRDHYDSLRSGMIVKVRGTVMTYNDRLQLSVEKIRPTVDADGINPDIFLPSAPIDIETLYTELLQIVESVQNPPLAQLLRFVFNDEKRAAQFKLAPGGKLWHHAYKGGLLEHTMSVVRSSQVMAERYSRVDHDLLITGALLHDIGKLEEYGFSSGYIDFTDRGRLWGHISIGAQMVKEWIDNLPDAFPEELKNLVVHMILSHQGELQHGSPVLPAIVEAIILYYADEMDSKANAVSHIIERDSGPGRRWSQYINLLDRFIYLGETNPEEDGSP